jgi:hypothetical protein
VKDSSRKPPGNCLSRALIIGIIILCIAGVIGVSLVQTLYSSPPLPSASPTAVSLPPFPWPPPEPSTSASLTLGSLGQLAGAGLTFHDVDARISQALATAGYDEKSYYGVLNGFAIVTRLEQTSLDGYPEIPDRWVSSLAPVSSTRFSLSKYLEALFGVPQGHYRIFVFIVTSDIVVPSGTHVPQGEAQTWFIEGANKLPGDMGTMPYTSEHTCTVYIYEFVQAGVGGNANLNIPSSITGKEHLERAGLWDILEK